MGRFLKSVVLFFLFDLIVFADLSALAVVDFEECLKGSSWGKSALLQFNAATEQRKLALDQKMTESQKCLEEKEKFDKTSFSFIDVYWYNRSHAQEGKRLDSRYQQLCEEIHQLHIQSCSEGWQFQTQIVEKFRELFTEAVRRVADARGEDYVFTKRDMLYSRYSDALIEDITPLVILEIDRTIRPTNTTSYLNASHPYLER